MAVEAFSPTFAASSGLPKKYGMGGGGGGGLFINLGLGMAVVGGEDREKNEGNFVCSFTAESTQHFFTAVLYRIKPSHEGLNTLGKPGQC